MKKCRFLFLVCLLTLSMTVSVFADGWMTFDDTKIVKFGFDNVAIGIDEQNDLRIYCDGWIFLVTGDESNEFMDYAIRYYNDDNKWSLNQSSWGALIDLSSVLSDAYKWTDEEISKLESLGLKWGSVYKVILADDEFSQIDCDIMCENGNVSDDNSSSARDTMAWVVNKYKDLFLSDSAWNADGTYNREGDIDDENRLPMLHYTMTAKNVLSFPNFIDKKITIDWDISETEPYASDPMAYEIEILISAHFYPNSEGKLVSWDWKDTTINEDENCRRIIAQRSLLDSPQSFKYLSEGVKLYEQSNHIFATDELQDGYYLYIRTYSKDGLKSSNYKVYQCTTAGITSQNDITYDINGKKYELDEKDKDEAANYTNEYDSDSSTSAETNKESDSYKGDGGYSFDTLYGNLKSMVNMLQGVPELMAKVMSWLPAWLPTMIATMIGLLVVIGVLKYIF